MKNIHPMGSRQKLALFNIIGPDIKGASFLDLYSGTGALALLAHEKGARPVIGVDTCPPKLSMSPGLTFVRLRVAPYLARNKTLFDFIVADPPYDAFFIDDLREVSKSLVVGGHFILSSPANLDPPIIPNLTLIKTRSYANARLSVYSSAAADISSAI